MTTASSEDGPASTTDEMLSSSSDDDPIDLSLKISSMTTPLLQIVPSARTRDETSLTSPAAYSTGNYNHSPSSSSLASEDDVSDVGGISHHRGGPSKFEGVLDLSVTS